MAYKTLILLTAICSTPLLYAQQEDGIGINGNQATAPNGLNNNSRNAGRAIVSEIPAMTVPHSVIDMDSLPLGPTSLAALNAVGSNGGSDLAGITLVPNTAAVGVYNTNVCGYALAAEPGSGGTTPAIIDASGAASFDAMDITLDLGGDSTEFGLLIADWVSTGALTFYSGGVEVTTITTSPFSAACGELFFQMTGGTFDQVVIKVSNTVVKWCVPQIAIEQTGGSSSPTLSVTNLIAGQVASVNIDNATPNNIAYFVWSLTGGGPIGTPYGQGMVSPPYHVIPLSTDSVGNANMTQFVPAGTTGMSVWFHGADRGTASMLNAIAATIG